MTEMRFFARLLRLRPRELVKIAVDISLEMNTMAVDG